MSFKKNTDDIKAYGINKRLNQGVKLYSLALWLIYEKGSPLDKAVRVSMSKHLAGIENYHQVRNDLEQDIQKIILAAAKDVRSPKIAGYKRVTGLDFPGAIKPPPEPVQAVIEDTGINSPANVAARLASLAGKPRDDGRARWLYLDCPPKWIVDLCKTGR